MFENVALQEFRCYTSTRSQQLAIFLAEFPSWISLFSYPELVGTKNEKRAPMSPCFKKTAVKLREKLLEGRSLCSGTPSIESQSVYQKFNIHCLVFNYDVYICFHAINYINTKR